MDPEFELRHSGPVIIPTIGMMYITSLRRPPSHPHIPSLTLGCQEPAQLGLATWVVGGTGQPQSSQGENPLSNPLYYLVSGLKTCLPSTLPARISTSLGLAGLSEVLGAPPRAHWPLPPPQRRHYSGAGR